MFAMVACAITDFQAFTVCTELNSIESESWYEIAKLFSFTASF